MENNLNKIFHMDCIEFMKNMKDQVDYIITDIPYDVVSRETGGIRIFDKKEADEITFDIKDFCELAKKVTKKDIFIFCSSEQVTELFENLKDKYNVKLAIWKKNNPSPVNGQHFWLSGIECCVVASKKEISDTDLIWEFPSGRSKDHPTEKPSKLLEHIITKFTEEGDIIYDPCSGSGSHLLAAKKHNRNYIGTEAFENYFKLMLSRGLNG